MGQIRKAVILAAGKGRRMGSLTGGVPKPMLAVNGKPILEHALDRLLAAGIEEALVVVGYHGEQIRGHLAAYPMRLEFQEQTVLNGTAQAALLARDFVALDPFLLTFGDIVCPVEDYRGLMAVLTAETDAVLGVKYVEDPWQGAAVYEERGRVVRIVEKPPPGTSATHWNSAGVYAFRPSIFEEAANIPLSPRGEYELTSAVEQTIAHPRMVRLYAILGDWMDVGRPEDLERARNVL